eukprot:4616697-Pyramimonas_sp.AAC.1
MHLPHPVHRFVVRGKLHRRPQWYLPRASDRPSTAIRGTIGSVTECPSGTVRMRLLPQWRRTHAPPPPNTAFRGPIGEPCRRPQCYWPHASPLPNTMFRGATGKVSMAPSTCVSPTQYK